MLFTRKIGKVIRGEATATQLMLACVVGAMLGFMPGFVTAGGAIVLMVMALVVLNANLAVAALVGAGAKLLSLVMLPVSFTVGRLLLDGPTEPLFKAMINAPVLALFGLEYYVTTGGLVVGALVGVVVGLGLVTALAAFRKQMATLEEGSPRYQRWSGKWWVKALGWVVLGGGSKKRYAEILDTRGAVIRKSGVAAAGVLLVLLVAAKMTLSDRIVTAALKRGLEQANGATVDLGRASVDLSGGAMMIEQLAMADPNALEHDLLRAGRVEIDIRTSDLLRKRLTLDRVTLIDGRQGGRRAKPGRRVGFEPQPSPPPPTEPGEQRIEDYIANAKRWKDRLAQVRYWIDLLSGPAEQAETDPAQRDESLRERLARQAREMGYANLAATHLITGLPTLTVRELVAEQVRVRWFNGETLDVHGRNLSTHPHLLAEPPEIHITSSQGTLKLAANLGSTTGGQSTVALLLRGVPGDAVGAQMTLGETRPISGGTVDVALEGELYTAGTPRIDMPLVVTLHDTTLALPGLDAQRVETLTLPIGLRGPVDNPVIRLDPKKLAEALAQAGAGKLLDKAGGKLRGFFGGGGDKQNDSNN